MKQNITAKQLNELSEKGKKKLWDWIIEKPWWEKYSGISKSSLLSIGQMIEFLAEYSVMTIHYQPGAWDINYDLGEFNLQMRELADALWEAVKEVLEEK